MELNSLVESGTGKSGSEQNGQKQDPPKGTVESIEERKARLMAQRDILREHKRKQMA